MESHGDLLHAVAYDEGQDATSTVATGLEEHRDATTSKRVNKIERRGMKMQNRLEREREREALDPAAK